MNIEEVYEHYSCRSEDIRKRILARFYRAGYVYQSIITGRNVVISVSTHDYNMLKSFMIYLGIFVPITLNKYYLRKVVEISKSTNMRFIVPAVGAVHVVTSALGGSIAFGAINIWKVLRRMYFASYMATLVFLIDDPKDKVYQQSKIMRNTF